MSPLCSKLPVSPRTSPAIWGLHGSSHSQLDPGAECGQVLLLLPETSHPRDFRPSLKCQLLRKVFHDHPAGNCTGPPPPPCPPSVPESFSSTCMPLPDIIYTWLVLCVIDCRLPLEYKLHEEKDFSSLFTAVSPVINKYLSNEWMILFGLYHELAGPGQQTGPVIVKQ